MTILIGFTSRGVVVLASDSQVTYRDGSAKDPSGEKVVKIDLSVGPTAILAKSGMMNTADYFHEAFQSAARCAQITGPRSVADLAENAMKHTHNRLLEGLRQERAPAEELGQKIRDSFCECLLGYMHEERPYLYSIALDSSLAVPVRGPFHVAGTGANLARSVLSGFELKRMGVDECVAVAAYAIEISKKFDEYCSGAIQIGGVWKKEGGGYQSTILHKKVAASHAAACEEVHAELRAQLPKRLMAKINEAIPLEDEKEHRPITPSNPQSGHPKHNPASGA